MNVFVWHIIKKSLDSLVQVRKQVSLSVLTNIAIVSTFCIDFCINSEINLKLRQSVVHV